MNFGYITWAVGLFEWFSQGKPSKPVDLTQTITVMDTRRGGLEAADETALNTSLENESNSPSSPRDWGSWPPNVITAKAWDFVGSGAP